MSETSGYYFASSGQSIDNVDITDNEELEVASGGQGNFDTVSDGGLILVDSGGLVQQIDVFTSGDMTVDGTAISSLVSGGEQDDGGYVVSSIVEAGGTENVDGLTVDTQVSSGGQLFADGGTASASVISAGGQFQVDAGSALDTELQSGAFAELAGGTTSGLQVDGGAQVVAANQIFGIEGDKETPLISAVTVGSSGAFIDFGVDSGGDATFYLLPSYAEYASASVDGETIDFEYALSGVSVDQKLTQEGADTFSDVVSANGGVNSHTYNGNIFAEPSLAGVTVSSGGFVLFERDRNFGAGDTPPNVLSGGIEQVGGTFEAYDEELITRTLVTVTSNIVSSGVSEQIQSNGLTSDTKVLSGGAEVVGSGGLAGETVVSSGGVQAVLASGYASGTIVSGGAVVYVSAGGELYDPFVDVQGGVAVSGGGLVMSATVGGGRVDLQAAGSASGGLVGGGTDAAGSAFQGLLAVSAGASATDITVLGGGVVAVQGVVSGATVSAGTETLPSTDVIGLAGSSGSISAANGGIVRQVLVNGGGAFAGPGGTLVSAFVVSGLVQVSAGGLSKEASVTTLSQETVLSGGSSFQDTATGGGVITVSAGGVATSSFATLSGAVNVYGSTVNADVIGGDMVVLNGGRASGTDVSQSGLVVVGSGGQALDTLLSTAGDQLQVAAGGIASATTVSAGGDEFVSAGGSAIDPVVLNGGAETLLGGGAVLSGGTISGGQLYVSGGTASGVSIEAGASGTVLPGGSILSATVGGQGAVLSVSGTASNTQVIANSVEDVFGSSVSAFVEDADETIDIGGFGSGAQITAGGTLYVDGQSSRAVVQTGSTEFVEGGGVAAGDTVDSAKLDVVAGGKATGETVQDEALAVVSSGGLISGASVITFATMVVSAQGSATNINVDSAGTLISELGGQALNVTVGPTGTLDIRDGGYATVVDLRGRLIDENHDPTTGVTIESGGVQVVEPGAVVSGVTVENGGTLILVSGASVTGETVLPGGSVISTGVVVQQPGAATQAGNSAGGIELASGQAEYVLPGGTAGPTTIDVGATEYVFGGSPGASTINGGLLDLTAGSAGTGPIAFAGAGGTLEIDDLTTPAAPISGLAAGDTVDLAALAYASGGSASVNANDLLTVTVGGQSYSLQLAGSTAGETFTLAPDNGTGTLVEASASPCYCRGTGIATPSGEVAVEHLRASDLVLTASGERRPIRWIGTRAYDNRFVRDDPAIMPIAFAAGSLGGGLPRRELLVSPEHAMFLEGVLVPAKLLVNGATIVPRTGLPTIEYFHIELDSHDILLAEGAPSESFVDCDSRTMFQNAGTFAGEALRWSFCAPRVEDGPVLARIRERLRPRGPAPVQPVVRGHLDWATHEACGGWAWVPDDPEATVEVELLVDGAIIARVTANGARPDVKAHGFGTGRYGFIHHFARPLSRFRGHEVTARAVGGGSLAGRVVLEAATELDPASLPALACALQARAASHEGAREVAAFLLEQWQAARARPRRRDTAPLALVLDQTAPRPGQDAGSAAITSHMLALRRLGYEVVFVPLDGRPGSLPDGVACAALPDFPTVEHVLREHAEAALVYVHRVAGMALYGPLIRGICSGARLVYSVADLHFVRLGRQAALEASPARMGESHRAREQELAASRLADMTLTHSTAEAALLRRLLPDAAVRVVPWHVPVTAAPYAWRRRSGLVFVGGMAHAPNADALRWLAAEIMPRIATLNPRIRCKVVGAGLTEADRAWLHPAMEVLGPVQDLARVYRAARLAVAPLRFGAGVKGKVLEASAAGLPCVMTPIAAEGCAWPEALHALVAADADAFADLVAALHAEMAANLAAGEAARAFVEEETSEQAVDGALANAVASARAPQVRTARQA